MKNGRAFIVKSGGGLPKSNFSTPPSVRFHNYPLYSFFKLKTGNFENILKADERPVLHDQCLFQNGDVPHPAAVCVQGIVAKVQAS